MTDNTIHQICTRCVMDTSDPEIRFDEQGVCNHCVEFETVTRKHWHPDDEGGVFVQLDLERLHQSLDYRTPAGIYLA